MAEFGYPHLHFRECDSTNTRARELADDGAPGGLVITAEAQAAGRGRFGRSWVAPPGGALLYSALLRPLTRANELLPLAVPLAVCEVAEALAPVRCQVKWPNDVWIDARKVAGILIEARGGDDGGFAVIGIGLNVAIAEEEFPAELREIATSVGHGARVADALRILNERLADWITRPAHEVTREFAARDALSGGEIRWVSTTGGAPEELTGIARGITERGELRVELHGGEEVHLSAGEVHLGHRG